MSAIPGDVENLENFAKVGNAENVDNVENAQMLKIKNSVFIDLHLKTARK